MRITRWKATLPLLVGGVFVTAILLLLRGQAEGPWAGPVVQMVQTDGFEVVWRMPGAGEAIVHIYGQEWGQSRETRVTPEAGWYRAAIAGLEPWVSYEYTIVPAAEAGNPSAPAIAHGRARTAPLPGQPFRCLAFGDSGSDVYEQQYALARIMDGYEADLVIHTGDVIHPDGRLNGYPRKFFQPYAALLSRVALFPCMGNHDWEETGGEPYFEVFALPANGPAGIRPGRHYWFDFGDVRFVSLDSNDTFQSMRHHVAPWLEGVLQEATTRWKILFLHHPIYTSKPFVLKGSLLQNLVPLIDRYGVDVVLSGHVHAYERTHPLRGGRLAEDGQGTVYVTTGAGGANLHGLGQEMQDLIAARNQEEHSFTVIDVTPEVLTFRQVGASDNAIDTFTISRREQGPAVPQAEQLQSEAPESTS